MTDPARLRELAERILGGLVHPALQGEALAYASRVQAVIDEAVAAACVATREACLAQAVKMRELYDYDPSITLDCAISTEVAISTLDLSTIPPRAAAVARVVEAQRSALEKCRELFTDIRGDWSDPRSKCRQGWAIIDAALAAPPVDALDAVGPAEGES